MKIIAKLEVCKSVVEFYNARIGYDDLEKINTYLKPYGAIPLTMDELIEVLDYNGRFDEILLTDEVDYPLRALGEIVLDYLYLKAEKDEALQHRSEDIYDISVEGIDIIK